ncbi:PrsW family intramembrane metalloprotease [Candidatus Cyanaurora vandensis]|uniref:PrsW family intramembrane metalloprotease n=1 Tax=Candidatus Cyanaurora vandensis TaxID=2714958 RepID=UPI00257E58F4|nr:PrsW family glutamic-type intramembrane protease [Candidatus Cyanaurora vandensis]
MNLQSLGLVSAAVAPAVVLLGGVALRPRYPYWSQPGLVLLGLVGGCLAAAAALGLETLLTMRPWEIANLGGLAFFTLAGVGLVEEGTKFLALRGLLWLSIHESYDGIILATAVGLGFGGIENVSYVLDMGYDVALARAFTAVPLHGMLGVILGFYLGQARVWEQLHGRTHWGLLGLGLGTAVLGHGVYDFLAFQSSPVAESLLWGGLVGLVVWSWRLIVLSRSWSPSWGGADSPFAEAFYVAPRLVPRSAWRAGLLGLIPGLGQWYNGEGQKAGYLALAGVLNGLLFVGLWWLVADPQTALLTLLGWGLLLGPQPGEFILALQQSPVLIIVGMLMVSLSLLGAVDAFWVARNNRFDYLQAPALRVRWLESLALAYGGHLLALLLLVLVPILGGGGGRGQDQASGSPPPLVFDLVSEPTALLGHDNRPAGQPQGQDRQNRAARPEVKAPATDPALGLQTKPQPGEAAQTAQGVPHSYNDYISGELRRAQDQYDIYFSRLLPGEYTVVQYRISSTGEVYDVQVLAEHTNAPPQVAQLAIEDILRLNPLLPPPTQGREVVVTELFWRYEQVGTPESLEDQLSRLSDGRRIEVQE